MIFVTTGTQFHFDRLLDAIEYLIGQGIIQDEVIAQTGIDSTFKSEYITCIKIMNGKAFEQYLSQASLIITHAGMGTILSALDNLIPVIAIPRSAELGEHVNNHQLDSLEKINNPSIIKCFNLKDLPASLEQADLLSGTLTTTSFNDLSASVVDMLK